MGLGTFDIIVSQVVLRLIKADMEYTGASSFYVDIVEIEFLLVHRFGPHSRLST